MSAPTPVPLPAGNADPPRPEEILGELETLLASRLLRESQQLQTFLEFVVRETLAGRSGGLKEYLLGCQVFGRKPDYEPRHDGIVRVQATALRKRLERYYAGDGANDLVVVELPRGGYVPTFRYRASGEGAAPAAEAPAARQPDVSTRRRLLLKGFLAGAAITGAVAAAWLSLRPAAKAAYRTTAAAPADFPELWSAFFDPGVQNLVSFGVPLFYRDGSGIYVRDVRVNSPGRERESRIDEFARKMNVSPVPTDDTYTGVGELMGTNLVAAFLASRGAPVKIASARTIAESDLPGQNLVVVSSLRFQTLLQGRRLPSDFRFEPTQPEVIRNLKPLTGEKEAYLCDIGAGVSASYALVSMWPGVTPRRRILYIGGVHTWATQAATEFVLAPNQLRWLAREFAEDRKTSRHGPVSPFFQILLRVEGRHENSLRVDYLTHHYLPASAEFPK